MKDEPSWDFGTGATGRRCAGLRWSEAHRVDPIGREVPVIVLVVASAADLEMLGVDAARVFTAMS